MSRRIGETHNRLETRLATSLTIALIGILSLNVYTQSPSQSVDGTTAADSLLSREIVVPLKLVSRFFPEITREARTGQSSNLSLSVHRYQAWFQSQVEF